MINFQTQFSMINYQGFGILDNCSLSLVIDNWSFLNSVGRLVIDNWSFLNSVGRLVIDFSLKVIVVN
ncbi:hypothetical protein Aoki45_10720 [Algoriphagus sp. oki45]|nr:hypothetical protein Aoki45_10720 [Algoriphagus sp. oki45]